jgi:nicotinate-nucleotide adenylyltransferase
VQAGDSAVRRLGVMGGTFDPIHVGHLVAASEALFAFELDRVIFVPTGQPWQKRSYSDAEDRYLMTVLGAAGNPRFAVSRLEIDRRGPTYTADTMEALRSFHGPGVTMYFIVGGDAALRLDTWKHIDRLKELAEIIAVTRPGFALGTLEREPTWPVIRIMEMPAIDISSTEIRNRVQSGRPIDYLVPGEVLRYIRERGLYAVDAEAKGA